ncbi:GIY-YIG nuclease family protein [Candidatus Saccharibacteria bacterium]|nr:GIY-YIG nuclease family protein [Candidatus Saccharibacteria bacterium]
MYYVYILQSVEFQRYYVGHTDDVSRRLAEHNSGHTPSTKPYAPWRIVYTESYTTKQDAYKRERQIKSYKGGRAFKALLNNTVGGVA